MRGRGQFGGSIYSLIFDGCSLYLSIFSLSGYMWPSDGHSGGPSWASMGSTHPQSLESSSGRRAGGPLRLHCRLVVRKSHSRGLGLTPGVLRCALSSRSLIFAQ